MQARAAKLVVPLARDAAPALVAYQPDIRAARATRARYLAVNMGAAGDGYLQAPDYVCCSPAQTANCPAGECCLDMSTGQVELLPSPKCGAF